MAPISVLGSPSRPSLSPHRISLPLSGKEPISPLDGLGKCHNLWKRRGGGGNSGSGGGGRGGGGSSSGSSCSSSRGGPSSSNRGSPSSSGSKTSSGPKSPSPKTPELPKLPKIPNITTPKIQAGGLLPPYNQDPKPGKIPGYKPHHGQPHSPLIATTPVGHGHKAQHCGTACRTGLTSISSIMFVSFVLYVIWRWFRCGRRIRREEQDARREEEVAVGETTGRGLNNDEERTTHGQGLINSLLWLTSLRGIIPQTNPEELNQSQRDGDVELMPPKAQAGVTPQTDPNINKSLPEIPSQDSNAATWANLTAAIDELALRSPPPRCEPQRHMRRGRSSTSRDVNWNTNRADIVDMRNQSFPSRSQSRTTTDNSDAADADDERPRSRSISQSKGDDSDDLGPLVVRDSRSLNRRRLRLNSSPDPSSGQRNHSSSCESLSMKTARSRASSEKGGSRHSGELGRRSRSQISEWGSRSRSRQSHSIEPQDQDGDESNSRSRSPSIVSARDASQDSNGP